MANLKENKRSRYEVLRAQLDNERSSFIPDWREIGDFLLPRRPRFMVTDANRGGRRSQKIIDNTGTLAIRSLRSGMMGGVTSPARPWFRLTTPDPDLAEYGSVKYWLHSVTQRMTSQFLKSNLYNILPMCYGDLGTFGTAPISIEEEHPEPFRFGSFPTGSYYLANGRKGKVEVFMRDFRMTVRQLVEEFGNDGDWSNFSEHVRNLYDQGFYETWIDVVHLIQPNEMYEEGKLDSKFKRFKSCYYERGKIGSQGYLDLEYDRFLRESGFDYFPILCPRWELASTEDVYATNCPGFEALGDVKQLQMGERRGMQAIEKMVNPPIQAPISMRNQKTSILPGDINWVADATGGMRPVHEVRFDVGALEAKQDQVRGRIKRAFFEDLFLMLSQSDRREITAREIDERHEEKLLALGPVLEQLNQDLLKPLVDISFDIMNKRGLIPPAPEEVQGMDLKVEFVSIMAQAQKLIGIGGIERFAGFASQVAAVSPQSLDKVDTDEMLDVYADITSIPPGIVRTDDQVATLRAQREKQMKAQQIASAAPQMAGAAKDLSQAKVGEGSALDKLLAQATAGI